MKNLKFFFLGLMCLNLFMFSSCGDDEEMEDDMMDPEIVDIVATAQGADNLTSLVAAVTQAGLVETLQGDGPLTVFAPTDEAFQALLDSNDDWSSLADIDNAVLADILKFHVLAGDIKAADLTDSYQPTVSTGVEGEAVSLQIDVTGGVKFNGSAEPETTDIEATNGTVHIIDEVMLRPTVVNHALNNPIFSSLVAALTRSDLTTDFVAILNDAGPYTVFAPTNEAFQALLDSDEDWAELGDIPVETLDAVLKYHVISGSNRKAASLNDGDTLATFGGNELTVDLSDGAKLTTASGQSVTIEVTDVQGTNGVVHAVKEVLLF